MTTKLSCAHNRKVYTCKLWAYQNYLQFFRATSSNCGRYLPKVCRDDYKFGGTIGQKPLIATL